MIIDISFERRESYASLLQKRNVTWKHILLKDFFNFFFKFFCVSAFSSIKANILYLHPCCSGILKGFFNRSDECSFWDFANNINILGSPCVNQGELEGNKMAIGACPTKTYYSSDSLEYEEPKLNFLSKLSVCLNLSAPIHLLKTGGF